MAYFDFKEYKVYYEEYGEGKPLIILNGIMMSTKSWAQFIETFAKYRRLILVDFLDQGQSSKLTGMNYNHDIQVEVVAALIKHLSLEDVALCGISYGGEIALQYALKDSTKLEHLLLFNTTAWTSPWLEEVGNAWNKAIGDPQAYYATTIPVIYSPLFYAKENAWIESRKEVLYQVFSDENFMSAMERLTNSSVGYDCRNQLSNITTETLVISSEYDFVTPKNEQEFLVANIRNASHIMLPNVGHASMYENSKLFTTLVLGFIL